VYYYYNNDVGLFMGDNVISCDLLVRKKTPKRERERRNKMKREKKVKDHESFIHSFIHSA